MLKKAMSLKSKAPSSNKNQHDNYQDIDNIDINMDPNKPNFGTSGPASGSGRVFGIQNMSGMPGSGRL